MKRILLNQILILTVICFLSICALGQAQKTLVGLKLSSKPKPIYTDKARSKNVEGTVKLKVVFLASGEIGDVMFVSESSKKKKLTKYGLVEKAIEAAKQIKFEPARKDGQLITSIAVIEYTFTLY